MNLTQSQIKKDYSADIAKFVENGGQIKPAVNTNKAEFNHFNPDTALKNAERPSSHQNAVLRQRADNLNQKSYTPVAACKSCGTSERSVRSNLCLECDRRRAKAKMGVNKKTVLAVGAYLVNSKKTVEFVQGNKKYILKVEEV